MELQAYSLEMRHVKGKTNIVADILSKTNGSDSGTAVETENVEAVMTVPMSECLQELQNNPEFEPLIQTLLLDEEVPN